MTTVHIQGSQVYNSLRKGTPRVSIIVVDIGDKRVALQ